MSEPTHPFFVVHVVTHTHWDREWYRAAEEFRLGLVDLVDEVLDGAAGPHFLLDGQAIVLLDYLAVRPERERELRDALGDRRIEAGPWYVLGDNLIPSGEALVRNLLHGREVLARLGTRAPAVLYCPDAFGHPAALPRLAAGFGIPLCIVWRGYGGEPWPAGDSARWQSADGSSVILHHLAPDGYELGSNLSPNVEEARLAWTRIGETLASRATLGPVLLPNGADHHAVQLQRREALQALVTVAAPAVIRVGSLQDFADAIVARGASCALPVVHGELRASPDYVWSLQGTFGTRAYQKRANARCERLLVHHVEPLLAMAWWRDGRTRRHEVRALWRTLLSCHPHDTLCGCSIDGVAEAMDRRLDEVERGGALSAARARLAVLEHDAARARQRTSDWRPVVVTWNPVPRPRGGLCELEIDEELGVVPVGPGSASTKLPPIRPSRLQLDGGAIPTQELSRERVHARDESPRHYPRNALVVRRRVLAWLPEVPPLGVRTIPLARGGAKPASVPSEVTATRDVLDNGRCRVWVDERRSLCIAFADGTVVRDVLGLEVVGDRGDLYTHSPIPGTLAFGRITRHRVTMRGPMRAALRLTMKATIPVREVATATGEAIRRRVTPVTLTVDVLLDAGANAVVLSVVGRHEGEDCRLRLLVRTGLANPQVHADASFGEVARSIIPASDTVTLGAAGEAVTRTAPLHRFIAVSRPSGAVTLLSDGLAEYEAMTDGTIAVTLVRSVGELSRHDLPERPGHAGWPTPTPGAQCQGAFAARFALTAHPAWNDDVRVSVQRLAEDFLLPIVGDTWRSAIAPPEQVAGPSLHAHGLAFTSCKESDDGGALVVRCVNLFDRPVDGAWQLAGLREAFLSRLDETPLGALVVRDDMVAFSAPPLATMTILLWR